jgi:RNA polymerase sigma factor (sigma-70 family)
MNNPDSSTVLRWLESPYLSRIASRVAYQFRLPAQDAPDLLQEVRLALWQAGPETIVNATWVFHTANHKAADLVRRRARIARENAPLTRDPPLEDGAGPALRHLLRARAALLPGRIHAFYMLRYEEGLSQREIAARMGICRGSVRCLDRQCLRMVKGFLAQRPADIRFSS